MSAITLAVQDTTTLTGRMLRHNIRSMDTIMTVVAMPLMILLAFVYVLGGAMDTGPIRYIDFVLPVVLLMCIASGVAYTAFRVNNDVTSGMFARFHTMPIAKSALLGGHIVASIVVNAISVAIIFVIALLIGYRPQADLGGWLITLGLLALVLIAFSIMGVAFGLAAKTAEGSGMFSYLLMALLFVSSGFAPTNTMPTPLRAFADHQPLTYVINAVREAQLSLPLGKDAWIAAVWMVALIVVFAVLARAVARRGVQSRL